MLHLALIFVTVNSTNYKSNIVILTKFFNKDLKNPKCLLCTI